VTNEQIYMVLRVGGIEQRAARGRIGRWSRGEARDFALDVLRDSPWNPEAYREFAASARECVGGFDAADQNAAEATDRFADLEVFRQQLMAMRENSRRLGEERLERQRQRVAKHVDLWARQIEREWDAITKGDFGRWVLKGSGSAGSQR
jgi:hypothetical protein